MKEEFEGYEFRIMGDFITATCVVPSSGTRCGYIGLPAAHPWAGKWYDDIDCTVHGGLTFSNIRLGMEDEGEESHPMIAWWVGFDCNHAWDFAPKMHERLVELGVTDRSAEEEMQTFGTVYRDLTYVLGELERLVAQASEAWRVEGPVDPVETRERGEEALQEQERQLEAFRAEALTWANERGIAVDGE